MGGQIKLLRERRGLILHYDRREALRFQDPLHTLRHIQPLYTPHHPQCTCVEELPPHAHTHTQEGCLLSLQETLHELMSCNSVLNINIRIKYRQPTAVSGTGEGAETDSFDIIKS